ncbi:GNAT family N-acetyltransferase [Paenibacillus hexagrammi]|uniref:GNAT family N-acetyltransferase n=1 Tax=Paenibacillus hexagrammi TaxID=2908839 RepID=A0ABY3SQV7_9BACL|nr:GNAT family N-acetyltransferase [Paenibacillus sp. YPD9-1]UJF35500.1 GNAT family N-acetyltransferase [Paenibacillus sp. YPD9-1]
MKEVLRSYKHATKEEIEHFCIPIIVSGERKGRLRPITLETIDNESEIQMLTEWRSASSNWFTTQFPFSQAGTKRWLQRQVIEAEDRILFFVEDEEYTPIGQIGLIHYDEQQKECEFDNLLRGRKGRYGNIIIHALIAIGAWSIRELHIQRGYLNVLGDNARAIRIYLELGAQEVKRTPLVKRIEGEQLRWTAGGLTSLVKGSS